MGFTSAGGASGGRRLLFLVAEVGWRWGLPRLHSPGLWWWWCACALTQEHQKELWEQWIKVSWDHIWLFFSAMKSFFLSAGPWQSPDRFWAPLVWVLRLVPPCPCTAGCPGERSGNDHTARKNNPLGTSEGSLVSLVKERLREDIPVHM